MHSGGELCLNLRFLILACGWLRSFASSCFKFRAIYYITKNQENHHSGSFGLGANYPIFQKNVHLFFALLRLPRRCRSGIEVLWVLLEELGRFNLLEGCEEFGGRRRFWGSGGYRPPTRTSWGSWTGSSGKTKLVFRVGCAQSISQCISVTSEVLN